jgi:hypothetical protein
MSAQPHRFASGDATGVTAADIERLAKMIEAHNERFPDLAIVEGQLRSGVYTPPQPQQSPQAQPVGTVTLPDGRTFTAGEP